MTEGKQIPTPLRIIGWMAIAMSVSRALYGCSMLLAPGAFSGTSEKFGFAAVVLVMAVIGLWVGIGLLRLRAWARITIQVFCWLYGIVIVAGLAMKLAAPFGFSGKVDYTASSLMGLADFGFQAFVQIIVVFVVLRYLRGPEARAAVAGN
jgi:hypothetical protein